MVQKIMHFLHTVLKIKAKKFYRYCNAAKNWHTHKLFSFLLLGFRMIYLRPAYLNNSIRLKTWCSVRLSLSDTVWRTGPCFGGEHSLSAHVYGALTAHAYPLNSPRPERMLSYSSAPFLKNLPIHSYSAYPPPSKRAVVRHMTNILLSQWRLHWKAL